MIIGISGAGRTGMLINKLLKESYIDPNVQKQLIDGAEESVCLADEAEEEYSLIMKDEFLFKRVVSTDTKKNHVITKEDKVLYNNDINIK